MILRRTSIWFCVKVNTGAKRSWHRAKGTGHRAQRKGHRSYEKIIKIFAKLRI